MSRRVSISMKDARVLERLATNGLTGHSDPEGAETLARFRLAMEPRRKPLSYSYMVAKREKVLSKQEAWERRKGIREECLQRAGGRCECGCAREVRGAESREEWSYEHAELDHMFGRSKGRLPESVETCWILRADCHRQKTRNEPDAATWWRKFIEHCGRQRTRALAYDSGNQRAAGRLGVELAGKTRLRFVETRSKLPSAPRVR